MLVRRRKNTSACVTPWTLSRPTSGVKKASLAALDPPSMVNLQLLHVSECRLNPLTTELAALATLSQWPHQRGAQKERNDRLFIIGRPLCHKEKSIIKTRLTAKITAASSIVQEWADFFFFLKGLLTSPASPWCNLLSISNPIAFWNWIYLTHSHSEWTLLPEEKKRRNCLRSCEVLDLSGTSVSAASFQIGRPHYSEGGWSRTLRQTETHQEHITALVPWWNNYPKFSWGWRCCNVKKTSLLLQSLASKLWISMQIYPLNEHQRWK